ncbi:MAG: Eco57I restriction-modification methylase domain-containing protein [bacterium]|nr:Eco57I restriction-modification methylase domain-containing protein [bacterium]
MFANLYYPKDNILDPSYRRNISDFDFAKEEKEKIKEIYTVLSFDGKLPVFLIETKTLPPSLIRYITKHLAERYQRLLVIFTSDYKEYTFVFPEYERIEEGKHKLKLTRLIFDREDTYHTDLLTISNIALTGDEENWREVWKRWKEAFRLEKVTDRFFEDYKKAFFKLRPAFEKEKIPVKNAHELSQQFLNRLMFLYFISKKRWLNNDPKFIKWYWERYKEEKRNGIAKDNTFYENWLSILFLEAFNNRYSHPHYHPQDIKTILASAPYLNGGLFQRNDLDDLPFQISDSLFEEVFNFFEKYNFTIREDLPLDIEVAVDPQMIGYVYESLSNVAEEIYERQDLGIFYTSVIEVDFMCRRSVVEYLAGRLTGLPREQAYKLLFDEDKKGVEEYIARNNLWYRLEEALDNLAVVDPACGSGAFLVGMLHVLAELYRLTYSHIKREIAEFELKKKIIGNSLYGVDVMPWVVHLAELRLWLQLIIEEDIPYEKRKLDPLLPNLTLRLRVGDSLVQELGGTSLHVRDSKLSPSFKRKLSALKTEKEKYYNNDPTAKFKSDRSLLREEIRIFGEILDEKLITLAKEIQAIEGKKREFQYEMFEGPRKKEPKQKELFEQQIKDKEKEIEKLKETKRKIQTPEKKPFIWDIDFAEIFGDKGGFDIVIGNPPYVRQEKIAPPNKLKAEVTLEDKREYKDKLLSSIQAHFPFIKKIDKKSDYYVYFYLHGLSLLNDKGVFCFITSNSWLDVGYGKDLQEFLLKYCPIKAIYDNQAKRSFEHADVNTIIALFGSPLIEGPSRQAPWSALEETARFVMFKRPFEEVVNTKNLLAIEGTDTILKTDAYRVFPLKQENLLEEGWEGPEKSEEKEGKGRTSLPLLEGKFQAGKYGGNKWGGKYLRAPDIFFTILKKGKGKLVRLGDIAEVRFGIKTGCNEFFYLPSKHFGLEKEEGCYRLIPKHEGLPTDLRIEEEYLRPVIKSPRECMSFKIDSKSLRLKLFLCGERCSKQSMAWNYIEWGQSKGFHEVPSCRTRPQWWNLGTRRIPDIISPSSVSAIYRAFLNSGVYADKRLYEVYCKKERSEELLISLCSILTTLSLELGSRTGLGEGLLDLTVYELADCLLINPDLLKGNSISEKNRKIGGLFELGIDSNYPIRDQKPNPLPDRNALDDIVFDILDLTQEERDEVYWSVCELVKNRLDKARSV